MIINVASLRRTADDRVRVAVRVVCVRLAADERAQLRRLDSCRRRRRSSCSRSCRCLSATRCARPRRSVAPRVSRGACRTDVSFVSVLCAIRSLVLSAIPASGVSGAVRAAGSGDSLGRVEAARRSARAGGRARVRGDGSVRRQRRETREASSMSRRTRGATCARRTKSHRGRRRMRSSCRFSTAAACDTTPTELRCGTTGCRKTRSMRRFATWQRRGAARISSSTTGKRKSFAPASRRQIAQRSLGRPSRACPAAPKCAFSSCRTEVLLRRNEEGRSRFSPLLRHHGCAHLSADPPDGIGASERCRRPCAEYLDPLVEHAGGAVLQRRGGTRRRFFLRRA